MYKRETLGCVYVEGRLQEASKLLLRVLGNTLVYDSADQLFAELRSLGFSPTGMEMRKDVGTASVCITDPNIGQVQIRCQHINVTVH